jgi:hypothetical protein
MSNIHLNIDRIVLRGIDPADRNALTNGLKTELARLLADPATRASMTRSRRTPILRLGKMPLTPGTTGARKLGVQVAKGIGKGLKP